MTGNEYQNTVLSRFPIPYQNKKDMLRHAVYRKTNQ